jgi:predicted kinase
MTLILHVNGCPGVGKLTISRILAERHGARLVHNHVLLDPAESLFDRSNPAWAKLRSETRKAFLQAARSFPADEDLILTDAMAPEEESSFLELIELADDLGATLASVVLDCDEDENVRRVRSESRIGTHKLTNPDVLLSLRAKYDLLRTERTARIDIDVTQLSAEEAADAIEQALAGLSSDDAERFVRKPADRREP